MPKTVEIKGLHSHARRTDAFICPSGSRARVRVPSVSIVSLECDLIGQLSRCTNGAMIALQLAIGGEYDDDDETASSHLERSLLRSLAVAKCTLRSDCNHHGYVAYLPSAVYHESAWVARLSLNVWMLLANSVLVTLPDRHCVAS
jgi:hypothetical protein